MTFERTPWPAVLALATSLSLGNVAHAAAPSAVSIGDVQVSVDAGASAATAAELGLLLRAALREELGRVGGLGRVKRPLILSAIVTRVSSERSAERAKASVAISVALLRAEDRVLFAELHGRASVEEASDNVAALQSEALRGAVQRALSKLPEAMRRSG